MIGEWEMQMEWQIRMGAGGVNMNVVGRYGIFIKMRGTIPFKNYGFI